MVLLGEARPVSETALAHIQLACLGLPTLVAACFAWIPLLALGSGSGKKTVVKAWWCPGLAVAKQ